MAETLIQKAQRLGLKPQGQPVASQTGGLLDKAQQLGLKPQAQPSPTVSNSTTAAIGKPSFLGNVANALTKNEQNLGKDIGRGLVGGDKFFNNITDQYTHNVDTLTQLAAKQSDPTMKQKYLDMAKSDFEAGQKVGADFKGRTWEQIAGDTLGVATDVGATLLPLTGVGGAVTKGIGFVPGAIQGAKIGAITGGLIGTSYGTAGALQENKSAGGVLGGAALGGVGGGITGGVLGGITGGITGALKPGVSDKEALSQVQSSLSNKEKVDAGARKLTGSPLTGVNVEPTNQDLKVAEAARPYLDRNIVNSENNIKNGISQISEQKILPTLDEFSTAVGRDNKTALINSIKDIKPLDITKNDPVRAGVYRDFQDRIINVIANAKDDKELFQARQVLDQLAEQQTNGKIWDDSGKLIPTQEVWRQGRRVINGFLGNRIPELSENLQTQTLLYDALEGVGEKTGKLIGKAGAIGKFGNKVANYAGKGALTALGLGGAYEVLKK